MWFTQHVRNMNSWIENWYRASQSNRNRKSQIAKPYRAMEIMFDPLNAIFWHFSTSRLKKNDVSLSLAAEAIHPEPGTDTFIADPQQSRMSPVSPVLKYWLFELVSVIWNIVKICVSKLPNGSVDICLADMMTSHLCQSDWHECHPPVPFCRMFIKFAV